MPKDVDEYLIHGCGRCKLAATPECKVNPWQGVLRAMREVVGSTDLKEEIKWGVPCYTYNGKNILMFFAFKETCAISFFKGSLLSDPNNLLEQPGPNTQGAKRCSFKKVADVTSSQDYIKGFIQEAIEIEKNGKKVKFEKKQAEVTPELLEAFKKYEGLEKAFFTLTPGRQRAYLLHFAEPKQEKTKISRIEKSIDKILNNKGLHDEYRNC